ncbi:MAG: tungsten ABC transporter substrate-binding protein [Proteobacteria bacterium]|nr:MAG: tungsten ABC transporter substrate-binding protein [Pseudomonadota bacterium]
MKKIFLTLGLSSLLASCLFSSDLMMATTTSTDNTGLLDYLKPKFEKQTGVTLKWVATGTGKALKMGKNCDVDILFVHAPASEKKFVDSGFGVDRRQVMYNDFIIVGPQKDPAKVAGLTPSKALAKIKDTKNKFFSRGDNSGTNKKEISLWKKALKKAPENEAWYVQTGQGMLRTINMASEKDGYTMTDRGTWIKYESQHKDKNPLKIVVEGDKSLFNQYSVITINKKKCPNAKPSLAKKFTDWIVNANTQKIIADFRLLDKALFIPNADK